MKGSEEVFGSSFLARIILSFLTVEMDKPFLDGIRSSMAGFCRFNSILIYRRYNRLFLGCFAVGWFLSVIVKKLNFVTPVCGDFIGQVTFCVIGKLIIVRKPEFWQRLIFAYAPAGKLAASDKHVAKKSFAEDFFYQLLF